MFMLDDVCRKCRVVTNSDLAVNYLFSSRLKRCTIELYWPQDLPLVFHCRHRDVETPCNHPM